jgi:hypothetical protein
MARSRPPIIRSRFLRSRAPWMATTSASARGTSARGTSARSADRPMTVLTGSGRSRRRPPVESPPTCVKSRSAAPRPGVERRHGAAAAVSGAPSDSVSTPGFVTRDGSADGRRRVSTCRRAGGELGRPGRDGLATLGIPVGAGRSALGRRTVSVPCSTTDPSRPGPSPARSAGAMRGLSGTAVPVGRTGSAACGGSEVTGWSAGGAGGLDVAPTAGLGAGAGTAGPGAGAVAGVGGGVAAGGAAGGGLGAGACAAGGVEETAGGGAAAPRDGSSVNGST